VIIYNSFKITIKIKWGTEL